VTFEKEHDEDVETDEDILSSNKKFVMNELSKGISSFVTGNASGGPAIGKSRLHKNRKAQVRNFMNKKIFSGTLGEAWE